MYCAKSDGMAGILFVLSSLLSRGGTIDLGGCVAHSYRKACQDAVYSILVERAQISVTKGGLAISKMVLLTFR